MRYAFNTYQMKVEDHLFWIAESTELKGCVGQGETAAEAIAELEANEDDWLETAEEYGIAIPPENHRKEQTYSGKFVVRVSPFVHEDAASCAKLLGISLNQFANDALIYYVNAANARRTTPNSTPGEGKVIKMTQRQSWHGYNYEEAKEM